MVLERSTRPASCRALAPAVATAMARSHMRMRFQSPMFTTSETAPMVQKCVLLPTAPKMKVRAKAPQTTAEASAAGLDSVKRPRQAPPEPDLFLLREALALAQLVLQLRLSLLELPQAVVQVDVEVLLAALERLGLVREHLDRPAQLCDVLLQRLDQLGEIDDAVLARRIQRPKPPVDRRATLLDGLLARLDLLPHLEY